MAKINRYDTPARSNYFNTFVPLPLDQITALGMKRQEDLERKQEVSSKAIDQLSLVKYIPDSVDEDWVKNKYLPDLQRYSEEAMSVDLTNPVEWAKYSTKLRGIGTSEKIRRIEESRANYDVAQKARQQLEMEGKWNPKLNEDPLLTQRWDSERGIYKYMPSAYVDKSTWLDEYYKGIKPNSFTTVDIGGMPFIKSAVSRDQLNNVSRQYAQSLINTPYGANEVKLFKRSNPALAEELGSDEAIMKTIMDDYATKYEGGDVSPLPEAYINAMGGGDSKVLRSPFTTFPVEGQRSTLEEMDQLGILTENKINAGSGEQAKRQIGRVFNRKERFEDSRFGKPRSEWTFKDHMSNLFTDLNPIMNIRSTFKELPLQISQKAKDSINSYLDNSAEIGDKISKFAQSNLLTNEQKAVAFGMDALYQKGSSLVKTLLNPKRFDKYDNLVKSAEEISKEFPELTYSTKVDAKGNTKKTKLTPEQILNNYIDVLDNGTAKDVSLYAITSPEAYNQLNEYYARQLITKSAEIGGIGYSKGMRPIEEVAKDLGYSADEIANIMSDPKDNNAKFLGYGSDGVRAGTAAISVMSKKGPKKGSGVIMYINADDAVHKQMYAAHTLISNAKLGKNIDVPWTYVEGEDGEMEEVFFRLTNTIITRPDGSKDMIPVIREWTRNIETNQELPVVDEDNNYREFTLDQIQRISLEGISGIPGESIIPVDKGKTLITAD